MAYTDNDKVADEFVDVTFDAQTKVTAAQVNRWIDEADSVINVFIGKRYTTPVTGPAESLLVLQKISTTLVACRVSRKLMVKTPAPETTQGVTINTDPKKWAFKMIDEISKGNLDLKDSELANSTDGVRSFNSQNGIEPFYKRNVDQW